MMGITLFKFWWKAFLHPCTPIFRDALGHKTILRTWVGVAAGALLGVSLSWLAHLLSGQPPQAFMGIASIWVAAGTPPPFSSWVMIALVGVILGFFDFEIALFIFARLLGGKGSFGAQAYAQSLFYVQLAVIQQVFAVTPIFGRPLFFLLAAYSLLPTTTSLKAAHGYSTWRAVLTWLMPILLNVVVVYVIVMLLISNVARKLSTPADYWENNEGQQWTNPDFMRFGLKVILRIAGRIGSKGWQFTMTRTAEQH